MKTLIITILLCGIFLAAAQPNTEVYLFDLDLSNTQQPLTNPVNISDNTGYDNQPAFWPDGKSIIYARTINNQTEIAQYFIDQKETKLITNTLQGSEYSPTPMPDSRISSIRLDTTGLQLLYAYDLDGNESILVKDLVIGYHAWINNNSIVSFVLGDTITMQMVNTVTGESKTLAKNIGRSLHKIPGAERFSFVDKSGDSWMIKSMHPNTEDVSDLIETPDGAEDYCWTSDERIIIGQNNLLWIWGKKNKDWVKLSDLSSYGLSGISRVTVSPTGDKIAIVVSQ